MSVNLLSNTCAENSGSETKIKRSGSIDGVSTCFTSFHLDEKQIIVLLVQTPAQFQEAVAKCLKLQDPSKIVFHWRNSGFRRDFR